jgi:multidrug efflux pump subunit AcrA (membrane-fusion protein)
MPRPVLILLVITATALSVGCTQSKAQQDGKREPASKVVKTEAVRQDSVRRSVEVVGTLAAEAEVTVSSQVEGVVNRVLADLGDRVRGGQTLVELDREKLQYSLDEQKATHSRALTRYGVSDSGALPPVEQTPDVRRAAAELAQAKQNHERAGELHRRRLISQQALEDAETELRLKTAAYDAALQNARNLRADIDASDATMKLADRSLRDAFIRAPFDGYVQKRMVSAGELVKAQMPVMTVVRVDPLKLTAEIPERMAPWVQVGQSLDFRVDAFQDQTFAATISRISPAVTTQTRTFAFEAAAPNENGRLKPGTFARVHLETALVESVLTVPYGAMQYRYGVYRVFTVDGDHLTAHELKTGDRVGDRMEILEGVKLGQLVALTDVDNLADGMKVTVERDTE